MGENDKEACVYEYMRKSIGRIRVTEVMAQCSLSKIDTIIILEELKSRGYIGGNARIGYWFVRTRAQL